MKTQSTRSVMRFWFPLAVVCSSLSSVAWAQSGTVGSDGIGAAKGVQEASMAEHFRRLTTIKLRFGSDEAVVELNDNVTSRDLVSMLPLKLKFSDYNHVEKIAYPSRKVATAGAPFGLKPSVGDFALYAPWGNLVAYYRSFQRSDDLIHLGRFSSGIEKLAAMKGEFEVLIEVAGQNDDHSAASQAR